MLCVRIAASVARISIPHCLIDGLLSCRIADFVIWKIRFKYAINPAVPVAAQTNNTELSSPAAALLSSHSYAGTKFLLLFS